MRGFVLTSYAIMSLKLTLLKATTIPKSVRLMLLSILIILLTAGVAFARAMQQGEHCSAPADSVVKGSMFTFCQNLDIAGKIEGNLIGIGLRTTITGEVGKNVYLAGLELDLTGSVLGDLHFVGLMGSGENLGYALF